MNVEDISFLLRDTSAVRYIPYDDGCRILYFRLEKKYLLLFYKN